MAVARSARSARSAPAAPRSVARLRHRRRTRCGEARAAAGGRRGALLSAVGVLSAAGARPARAEFTKLPGTGAVVERVEQGAGADAASAATRDSVVFQYVLRRANGYFVYSTTDAYVGNNDADEEPEIAQMGVGNLLPGLEEALEGERAGAVFRVLVPPTAGYQSYPGLQPQVQGFGPLRQIEAHKPEPLVFEVRLVKVAKGSAAAAGQ